MLKRAAAEVWLRDHPRMLGALIRMGNEGLARRRAAGKAAGSAAGAYNPH